jgi:hypothetical protein
MNALDFIVAMMGFQVVMSQMQWVRTQKQMAAEYHAAEVAEHQRLPFSGR